MHPLRKSPSSTISRFSGTEHPLCFIVPDAFFKKVCKSILCIYIITVAVRGTKGRVCVCKFPKLWNTELDVNLTATKTSSEVLLPSNLVREDEISTFENEDFLELRH